MTIRAFHRLRICIATAGLVVAGEAHAFCLNPCVKVNLNWNVQLEKLHPLVSHLQIRCDVQGAANEPASQLTAVVNRGYVGLLSHQADVPALYIASQANHTVRATCYLWLFKGGSAVGLKATVMNPNQNFTDSNWHYVADGSWNHRTPGGTIEWVQEVTFPNSSAP
jgi:hypothetical protein